MNSKLLIIVIFGLTAVGSLFLFSEKPKQQTANIVEAITTPSPTRFDLGSAKRSNLSKTSATPTTPTIQGAPLYTSSPSPTATPLPTKTPTPTLTPSPSTISISTPSPTPQQTSTPVPSGDSQQTLPSPSATPEQSTKININTADQQELEKITGVGPAIAQRIIDYRQTNGPFQKIEDIKNVKGIGDKTFEKMKNEITV